MQSCRYPKWRHYWKEAEPEPEFTVDRKLDNGETFEEPFDRLCLCRSGSWVPPWVDEDVYLFLLACPVLLKPIALEPLEPQNFSDLAAYHMAEQMRQLLMTR